MSEVLFDTNLLVYAFDASEPPKHRIAKKLVFSVFDGEIEGAVTNQILAEFCAVVMHKIEKPLTAEQAQKIIRVVLRSPNWHKLNYTGETLLRALTLSSGGLAFWDAVLVATAAEHNVREIWSEDQQLAAAPGIRVRNPFK